LGVRGVSILVEIVVECGAAGFGVFWLSAVIVGGGVFMSSVLYTPIAVCTLLFITRSMPFGSTRRTLVVSISIAVLVSTIIYTSMVISILV
jgi:hypothetical protein